MKRETFCVFNNISNDKNSSKFVNKKTDKFYCDNESGLKPLMDFMKPDKQNYKRRYADKEQYQV